MISRRNFFGAMAGSAALASTVSAAPVEKTVKGWTIEWGDWRTPPNQYVRVGVWVAYPLYQLADHRHAFYVSTTLGFVGPMAECAVIDFTRYDKTAPILPNEPERKFEAAKAWARENLVKKLESL